MQLPMQAVGRRVVIALLLLGFGCWLAQPTAAQRRQLTQTSWKSQSLSLAVTVAGPCNAIGYPTDLGLTFADVARRDAERLMNVLVARTVKAGLKDAGTGACLTRKVGNQTLAGLAVLLRLRGPQVTAGDANALVAAGQKKGPIGGLDCQVFPTVCLLFSTIGANILANNASYGASTTISMALPGTLPPPPSPRPGEDRILLKLQDFKYQGAFAIPARIPECNTRTSWSSGGLALHMRDGEPYFYSSANRSDGAQLYEFTYSGHPSMNLNNVPLAQITWCGGGYGKARTLTPGSQSNTFLLTHGMYYSDKMDRLYWTFGEEELSTNSNAYFLGYSKPSSIKRAAAAATASAAQPADAQPKAITGDIPAVGPWRIEPAASGDTTLHSQKVRGGALEIPQWFADKFLGGRNLGVGFGGYWNDVFKGVSMGPSLVAVRHPADTTFTGTLSGPLELLGYGFGKEMIERRYCPRSTQYTVDSGEYPWGKNPNKTTNTAFWAPGDSIEGAAVWVDNGTHHGLLFFPELGQGWIGMSQETGKLEQKWTMAHWYMYDPADLAAVALGNKDPWEVEPAEYANTTYPATTGRGLDPPTGQKRRVTGVAYNSNNQTLYVLNLHSGREVDEEYDMPFHLVHMYQLQPADTMRAMQYDSTAVQVAAVSEQQVMPAADVQQQQLAAAGEQAPAGQPLKHRRHLM